MNFRALEKTWIVAEIGVNHEGDAAVAGDLIAKAAECGVDAVKFQNYQAARYVSSVQPERRDAASSRALSYDRFRELAAGAREKNITFFSTPLSLEDVDLMDGITPLYKVASGEITWLDLIRHVASKGKPVILSTGAATLDEIRAAVEAVTSVRGDAAEKGELMLMHCVMAYPAPGESVNLANIAMLHREFGLPVGYSDHTLGIKTCELAVAAGATALEKHFTYRKEDQDFRDHRISADPADMKALVAAVRAAEVLVGSPKRTRQTAEEAILDTMRRSVAAARDIPAGAKVKKEWLTALRPLWGIPVERAAEVVGRSLKRDVPAGDLINEEDLA